jgi:NADH-quinone oxidoreductase subunit C
MEMDQGTMDQGTMSARPPIVESLVSRFQAVQQGDFRGQLRLVLPRNGLRESMQAIKSEFGFDMLVDITCVDYLSYRDASDRFGLVYLLANTETNARLTIRVMLNEPDLTVPSVVTLWEGANWMEREVFDMFGIQFEGHPDLRRILMPEEFSAFPLRKDYPLQGRGERHNFQPLRRAEA